MRFDADLYLKLGSTVLAHLYQELCRVSYDGAIEIPDCMTFL